MTHILDLMITWEQGILSRPPVVFISGVSAANSCYSLYHAVLCFYNANRHKTINKSVIFRAVRNRPIPVPAYRNDVNCY